MKIWLVCAVPVSRAGKKKDMREVQHIQCAAPLTCYWRADKKNKFVFELIMAGAVETCGLCSLIVTDYNFSSYVGNYIR